MSNSSLSPKQIQVAPEIARRPRLEGGASVYLLDGRWHLVVRTSEGERELQAAGALRVAEVRFGPGPEAGAIGAAGVRALSPREATRRFAWEIARN